MSATHHDPSFDSGHDHLRPLLGALAICAVTAAIILSIIGLPH